MLMPREKTLFMEALTNLSIEEVSEIFQQK